MKKYPQTVVFFFFFFLCCSWCGVEHTVSSHTLPCGHFTGCVQKRKNTKIKQLREGERKKQTNTDLEQQNLGGEVL